VCGSVGVAMNGRAGFECGMGESCEGWQSCDGWESECGTDGTGSVLRLTAEREHGGEERCGRVGTCFRLGARDGELNWSFCKGVQLGVLV
jgi:hypothetical protein